MTFTANLQQVILAIPPSVEKYQSQKEELNRLNIKVLQLRNRLSRQKKIRILNERSLKAGETRSQRVEGLLLEMQADLRCLKERLQDELNELGTSQTYHDKIDYIVFYILFTFRHVLGIGNTFDTNTERENVEQMEQRNHASLPVTQSAKVEDASSINDQLTSSQGGSGEISCAKDHVMNDKRRCDDLDGSDQDSKRIRVE